AFGRGPAAPCGRPVREMPAQQERVVGLGAARDLPLQANASRGVALRGFGTDLAVFGEVVPEEGRAGPPFGGRPSGEMGKLPAARVQYAERERTALGIDLRHLRIRHEDTRDTLGILSKLRRAGGVVSYRIVDGERDGYGGGRRPRIAHAITQHS